MRLSARVGRGVGKGKIKGAWEPQSGSGFILIEGAHRGLGEPERMT